MTCFNPDDPHETHTHADGVIGHFSIVDETKAGFSLNRDANQFIVAEAKMFSKLSKKVSRASFFDQVARYVACIAETMRLSDRDPTLMTDLKFCLIAPERQYQRGDFANLMTRESISEKVQRRVAQFNGEKDDWYRNWFVPVFDVIKIDSLTWEDVVEFVMGVDTDNGQILGAITHAKKDCFRPSLDPEYSFPLYAPLRTRLLPA